MFTDRPSEVVPFYVIPNHYINTTHPLTTSSTISINHQICEKAVDDKDFPSAVEQSVAVALGLNQVDVSVLDVANGKSGVEVTYIIADKYDLTAKQVCTPQASSLVCLWLCFCNVVGREIVNCPWMYNAMFMGTIFNPHFLITRFTLMLKQVDQALSDDATATVMDGLLADKGYKHCSVATGRHAITTDKVKSTFTPTSAPTYLSTDKPSHKPSHKPTAKPTHRSPTHKPSLKPSFHPTMRPIEDPNNNNDDFPAPLPKNNKKSNNNKD